MHLWSQPMLHTSYVYELRIFASEYVGFIGWESAFYSSSILDTLFVFGVWSETLLKILISGMDL